ncbi:MAG: efflux RND transporter periplasmic adaptor subunit [Candidatus Acidiferrales bacterium]
MGPIAVTQCSVSSKLLQPFGIPASSSKRAASEGSSVLRAASARTGSRFIVAALGLACIFSVAGCERSSPAAPPPPTVSFVPVQQKDVPIYGDWVATLQGYTSAQIQPEVTGYLVKQTYREGSFVRKDDVLFEIDPRPFQALLDQAKGQLAQANAQLGLAIINLNRDTPVAKLHAIPQSQLDNDVQSKLAAEALVQADQAAVEQAQLNLDFTKVRSLIDGIAGIAQTQIGSLVATSTVLTTVSKVDPIKVYFPISEQEYLRIATKISGTIDLLSDSSSVPLQLVLADGSIYPHPGRIVFADREVDEQTGTIRIVGAFANPGNILRPGQFGRVRAVTSYRKDALLVPQRAVTELQGKYQVATIGADNKVTIHTVTVGDRVGTMWVIADGLQPGERVVTEGVQKVAEGAPVTPVPDTTADGSN